MAILTINHNVNQANNFIEDINNTRNSYFVYVGKTTPWDNESSPPVANNSLTQYELSAYRDLLFGKLITPDNIINVIPRNNWTSGVVYSVYDQDDPDLFTKTFYVMNTSYDVFKCIDNNNGSASTIMPTLRSTSGTFLTGDGYLWKYMYTVDPTSNTKFTSSDFIPVIANTSVVNNAVAGTIDVIRITNGGNNYQVYETGTVQNIVNKTTVRISATSNPSDNYYACSSIYLMSGFGSGQIRQIVASNGAAKTVSVSPSTPFDVYEKLDLNLSSIVNPSNIIVGQLVAQPIDYISYLYSVGYFNINDTVVQTDSGVSGKIIAANGTTIQVNRSNLGTTFSNNLPIRSTSSDGTQKLGNVSISNTGALSLGVVTSNGTGYIANATVTITATDGNGGVANAQSNSTGKISALLVSNAGLSYSAIPSIVISDPANTTFNAQTAVKAGTSNNADSNCVITLGSASFFVANDLVTYYRASTNTANIGLTSGTDYYVQFANSTVLALSTSVGGSRVQLSNTVAAETGHSLKGKTATGTIYPVNYLVTNAASGSGTQLNDSANGYSIGDYIRVGTSTNTNIRKVMSVNSSVVIVDQGFRNSVGPTQHYKVPVVAEPTSIVVSQANGYIKSVDLTSLSMQITGLTIPNQNYIVGERVAMVNVSDVYQGANAIVAFANSSTLYLSSVSGSWTSGFYVKGQSSYQKASITTVTTNPSVVLQNINGAFVLGQSIFFGANAASAVLNGVTLLPTDQVQYTIGPTINITGDGSNAVGIGIVNNQFGSTNNIIGAQLINTGQNYTYANVQFVANGNYGSGATAKAIISPVFGHGGDPITELGGNYVGVYTKFSFVDDSTYFPSYNSFRKVGIIENPQFDNVLITVKNFDRVNFSLIGSVTTNPGISTTWYPGEVVVQSSTNAAGVVVSGNSSTLQLKNVKGTFVNTTSLASRLYGYYSNTYSNVVYANTIYFVPSNAPEIVSETTSNATAIIKTAYSNTSLLLGNVVGQFVYNDVIYDSVVNAYATVANIALSNGARDETTIFGDRFNNTLRLTLSSNAGAYVLNEYVVQDATNAYGRVISTNNEIDLSITMITPSVTYSAGQIITDSTTGANGIILSANATYLKLTSASPSLQFGVYNTINNGLGVTANTQAVYNVLLLNDVGGPNTFQGSSSNLIVGQVSGSYGYCNSSNLIYYPDLVKDTGKVIYLENVTAVQRSLTSKEEVKLVIKF